MYLQSLPTRQGRGMKKTKEKGEGRNWAELDEDILRQKILCRLPRQDYFRFGAVCRPWFKVQQQVPPPIGQLPWFLFNNYISSTSSSDGNGNSSSSSTSNSTTYIFYDPWKAEERSFSYHMDVDEKSIIHVATSHGWLFICEYDDPIEFPFLLNPFSGSRIQLPLVSNPDHHFQFQDDIGFSLSAPPTDPDCVVVALSRELSLASCRLRYREQEGWRYHYVNGNRYWNWQDVVFFNGSFYATDHCGLLGVLDLPGMGTRVINMDSSQLRYDIFRCSYRMVVSLGEILRVVVFDGKRSQRGRPDYIVQVYRANLTAKTWERVQSLRDRVLFLTQGDSISLSASTVGVPGDRIFLANSNYWGLDPSPEGRWFWMEYCLSDGSKQFQIDGTPAMRQIYELFFWMMPSRH